MRAVDSWGWKDLAAGTYTAANSVTPNANSPAGSFLLLGGRYMLDYIATTPTTCALQKLGSDGSTWEVVYLQPSNATPNTWLAALTTNGEIGYADLPPGQYRIVVATSTANYVSIVRIPISE